MIAKTWHSPIIGAVATTIFTVVYAFISNSDVPFDWWFVYGMIVWLVRDSLINLTFLFPMLLVLRRIGVRVHYAYISLSILCAIPMGYILSNPAKYEWHPTEVEVLHGPYIIFFLGYVLFASAAGGHFYAKFIRPNKALQATQKSTPEL